MYFFNIGFYKSEIDGRMQVQHRKTLPHLLYCQIWRWPDIRSQHELKSLDICQFSYKTKTDEVIKHQIL